MPLGANKAAIMGVAGVSTGDVVLLYDTDHSGVSSAAITSGITSTYGEYIFKFYNINPSTNAAAFQFNGSIDGGSNYNVPKTSVWWSAKHQEDDGGTHLTYSTTYSLDNATGYQFLFAAGNGADESLAGEIHLFNPSSTTYLKHYIFRVSGYGGDDENYDCHCAGYFNDADDNIDAVNFSVASGNFDGTIKMWGVK